MDYRQYFINLASVLVYFLPLALLSGPFFSDLFITIVALIFLSISFFDRNFSYFKNNFFYFFFIFYLYLVIRSIFSDLPYLSLESSLLYLRFFIFSLAIWFIINNNKKFLKSFSIIFILTYSLAMLDAFYQIFSINNIVGFECGYRMCLSLSNRMLLGSYFVRLLPILLICLIFIFRNNKYKVLIVSIFLILANIFIVMSGERTAVILLLIVNLLIFVLLDFFKEYRKYLFVLIIISVSMVLFLNPKIKERNIDYTLSQLNINLDTRNFFIFSNQHEAMFKTGINMFSSNLLLGVGPKLYRVKCKNEEYSVNDELSCSTHPHNIYIQALAETGILGGLAIVFLFFFISYLIIKNIRQNTINSRLSKKDYITCLLICFFINLWPIVPSLNLYNNWINILYFLPAGFYLYLTKFNFTTKTIK